jgi:hypothetical protein
MSTRDSAVSTIVPGVYWVTYSKEYRERIDKQHAACNWDLMPWSNRAFIAEWGTMAHAPTLQDYRWLIPGDEMSVEAADITIIAGPLEAPYVHP